MKNAAIQMLIALLGLVTPDILRAALDAALDAIEARVQASSTDLDDLIVLPLCATIRRAIGLPDEEEEK